MTTTPHVGAPSRARSKLRIRGGSWHSVLYALALLAQTATAADREPYASTYQPLPTEELLITGATVLTGTGERLDGADVHLVDGRIAAVGADLDAPGATVLDAEGLWLTPGIIDVHSHLGTTRRRRLPPPRTATKPPIPTPPGCGRSTPCGPRTRSFPWPWPAA
jgi:hypothetical protein